ncbi:dual specificity protein phosphatase 12 [Pelomyxa schiedti]|nr:dual specificity protein phosphatase 12 [Pelomyxa schiedti]
MHEHTTGHGKGCSHCHAEPGSSRPVDEWQPMFSRLYMDAPPDKKRLFDDELENAPPPYTWSGAPDRVPLPAQGGSSGDAVTGELFVGPYEALSTVAMQHVLLLCDPPPAVSPWPPGVRVANVMELQVLDDYREHVMHHFMPAIGFIRNAINNRQQILVCSKRGVSRAPCFIIAFILKELHINFTEALRIVKRARSVFLNEGFERQLNMFAATGCDPCGGRTLLHKHVRLRVLSGLQKATRPITPEIAAFSVSTPYPHIGPCFHCKTCGHHLFCDINVMPHSCLDVTTTASSVSLDTSDTAPCNFLHTEVLSWMLQAPAIWGSSRGDILCATCNSTLGTFNWQGKYCSCKYLFQPGFQFNKLCITPSLAPDDTNHTSF